jgi:hypothetical protein
LASCDVAGGNSPPSETSFATQGSEGAVRIH